VPPFHASLRHLSRLCHRPRAGLRLEGEVMRTDMPVRLGFAALTIFSLPMVLIQAIEIGWRVYLPAFFTTSVGLPLAAVGTLLLCVRLFDSIIDPFVAWASDQFPTRYGLRRPWIAASVPLVMIGALGVFFAAPGSSMVAVAVPCILLHLGYTMLCTPHGGWALEIAGNANERIRVMGAKQWFAVVGMIAILLFTAWLERGLGLGRREQTAAIGAVVLVLSPLSALLVVRYIREPAAVAARAKRVTDPVRAFIKIFLADRVGMILLLYLFLGLGDAAAATTFLFFTESALQLKGWGSALLLIQPMMAFVALPIWGHLSQRTDKGRVLALVYGWQLLTAPLALLLPAGNLGLAAAYLIARSAFSGVDYMLLRAMVADGAADGAAPGERNGATYYAAVNITLRIAMGVGAAVPLWLMAAAGFAEGAAVPGEDIGWTIRASYALPATIGALLSLLVLLHAKPRLPSVKRRPRVLVVSQIPE
jgi:GPH family glycoside/pentoside/hexuronide:cation symporter